ncbi:5'-nucleotidase C-terminal domain-containing protein [Salsuginibacillus kocurii]|uniref:5'-nucleotidase C-terminal domain-containing protein n=1 Tax=Salsuginibacillus kocurii TaxID=427078 RepID=UPI000380372B|nr:5'-nucleotidase C-terminal domain-containing protein [Salsuginibacillus kocurii]
MERAKGKGKMFLSIPLASTAAWLAFTSVAGAGSDNSYEDVEGDEWYTDAVEALTEEGVFEGRPDGTFGIEAPIERQHTAAAFQRALGLSSTDPGVLDDYEDVEESDSHADAIAAVTEAGIFEGDGTLFAPEAKITREETASILARGFGLDEVETESEEINLEGVHEAHQEDVQIFADLGLTTELDDFRAEDEVTRAEFAAFLYRVWELGEEADDSETTSLNIFHTNDLHGRTDAYPQLITTYEAAQEEYGDDGLLLDGGDVFSGTLYFNEFHGQDAVQFMNMMEYDAFVPGNHEFDLGDEEEGHPELAEFFAEANFPIVASNMDFSAYEEFVDDEKGDVSFESEDGALYDGIVEEVDGEEVGIFGLNTEDTVDISSPQEVEFHDYIETAEKMVTQFEEEGIDKIVALTHLGYDSDPSVGNDNLLAEHVEGIDVIIGGHSHDEIEPPTLIEENADGEEMEPTVIGQAGEYGEHVGAMQVDFDENGVVTNVEGELFATEDYDEDPEAAEKLEPYTKAIEEIEEEPAGSEVITELPNPRGDETSVRAAETALGNLITDAQLDAALSADDDVVMALQNGGGIREPIAEGEVTVGELINVQPFGNRLALLELSGEEIYEAFETSVQDVPDENGGFLQVSEGTQVTFDSDSEPGERVNSVEIEVDGEYEAIDEDETYTIATNNFTATGGDGFEVFADAYDDGRGTIIGHTDWEMLRDYMAELGEVDYHIEDRIVDEAQSEDND